MSTSSSDRISSTAGAVIIADEILSGKIQDTNTHFLARLLYDQGVMLRKVVVIQDDVDEIASTVRSFSEKYTYVFTSGGIGPTHDDMTYEGVAQAFGLQLEYHAPTLALMKPYYDSHGMELTEARKRMALLPQGCRVITTPGLWIPLAVVENVHIFPGVPIYFEQMLTGVKDTLVGHKMVRHQVYTTLYEGDLAPVLAQIHTLYPKCMIGSYPSMHLDERGKAVFSHVKITVDAEEDADPSSFRVAQRIAHEIAALHPSSTSEPHDSLEASHSNSSHPDISNDDDVVPGILSVRGGECTSLENLEEFLAMTSQMATEGSRKKRELCSATKAL